MQQVQTRVRTFLFLHLLQLLLQLLLYVPLLYPQHFLLFLLLFFYLLRLLNVLELCHLLETLNSGDLFLTLGPVYLLHGLFVATCWALFLFLFLDCLRLFRLLVLFAIVLFPRLILLFLFALLAHRLSLVDNIKIGTDKVVNRQLVNILFGLTLFFLSIFISILEHYNVIAVRLVFGLEALTRVQAFAGGDLDVFDEVLVVLWKCVFEGLDGSLGFGLGFGWLLKFF